MNGLDLHRWSEICACFEELVDLGPAERLTRLEQLGRDDPELRSGVDAMLRYDAIADDRLRRLDSGLAVALRSIGGEASQGAPDTLGLVGRAVAHFTVLEPLGAGGMGAVYRARDERLQRIVALKFPLPHRAIDIASKERFLREARSAGGLEHPNLCSIYEAGESESGLLFLAMPLYLGITLEAKLAAEAPLPVEEALEIARQIADGLACAHAGGVIHRDLKPGNVMLLPDGTAKILDFGLAKVADPSLTMSGSLLGTVVYMAPEQIRGDAVDARADLWALGVVLYEMIAGRRPFEGDRQVSVAHAVIHDEPQPLSRFRADVPRPVEHLLEGLLAKDPAHRYASAPAVAADIHAIGLAEEPTFRPRKRPRGTAWQRLRGSRAKLAAGLGVVALASGGFGAERFMRTGDDRGTRSTAAYEYFSRGREYEAVEDWTGESQKAAEALYRRAIEADPGFALAWARLANLHSNEQFNPRTRSEAGLERMRQEAETALKLDPRLGEAHLVLGFYWRLRDNHANALAALSLAQKYAPTDAEAPFNMGEVYAALGRWDDALTAMRRGVELDRKREGHLADTYVRLRRYDEGVRSLDRYLELVPGDYWRVLQRGRIYLNWRGTPDSLAAALAAVPDDWDFHGAATLARVTVAEVRRRPADGLAALPAEPHGFLNHSTPVSLVRARLHAQAGDTERARSEYEIARGLLADSLSVREGDAHLRISMAKALAGLGRREEAVAEVARARSAVPSPRWQRGPTIDAGAAMVYGQVGENGRAVDLLARLLQEPGAGGVVSAALLRVDPDWDPLRGDPRFAALLARFPE